MTYRLDDNFCCPYVGLRRYEVFASPSDHQGQGGWQTLGMMDEPGCARPGDLSTGRIGGSEPYGISFL